MINEALYNKTVDILVQAYFEDSLIHFKCQACAVGNLVAYYTGQRDENGKLFAKDWSWAGPVYGRGWCDTGEGIKQVKATGYTAQELFKIEQAFESKRNSEGDAMFNGLMAVIDVLDQIHENTDATATNNTKQRFVKPVNS